ncbi:MAG: hypothetical protein OEX81_02545 [Candidatus Pacebacteria bacterium]|nr:hypothetical protein [Candidatus Paceibacterota bacterium]
MAKKTSNRILWYSFALYFLSLVAYAIFSYSLTAPNLVLSTNSTFWKFQTYMWKTFFNNRELLTQTYFGLIGIIFFNYLFFVSQAIKQKINNFKLILILFFALVIPLLISNNALSYDAFNYIFNAKMVSVYHVDPHTQVALDFPDDSWTKFMHNTHTTAPYGRAWTYLSLVPFSLGMGKFVITWLSFRLFSLLPLATLLFIFWKYHKKINYTWLIFLVFNPLVLIEVISNVHNDFWMITPAILSLLLIDSQRSKKTNFSSIIKVLFSIVLLGLSIWIKLATILLIPIWLLILIKDKLKDIPHFYSLANSWPVLASLAMFAPLLTSRSQWFHPWYLAWSISFIPLFSKRNKFGAAWAVSLLVLSISSMYRYLPFLWHNNYDGDVLSWQRMITFIPFGIILILSFKKVLFNKKR